VEQDGEFTLPRSQKSKISPRNLFTLRHAKFIGYTLTDLLDLALGHGF
jgi:hypothetical protein